jgi:hypothetical protein
MLPSVCILPLSLLVQAPPLPHASVTLSDQVAPQQHAAQLLLRASSAEAPAATIFPPVTTILTNANSPFAEPEELRIDTVITLIAPFAFAYAIFTGFSKLWTLFSKN